MWDPSSLSKGRAQREHCHPHDGRDSPVMSERLSSPHCLLLALDGIPQSHIRSSGLSPFLLVKACGHQCNPSFKPNVSAGSPDLPGRQEGHRHSL